MSIKTGFRLGLFLGLAAIFLGSSIAPPGEPIDRVHAYTRQLEFDFAVWTIKALGDKLEQLALGTQQYLPGDARSQVVLDYLDLIRQNWQAESDLSTIYSDPAITDPAAESFALRQEIRALRMRRALLEPLAESILQDQVSQVVADLALSLGGQPLPPILYHTTPPPDALVVSPRDIIRQDANISIRPDLTVDQQAALEDQVDEALDVSSLVVGIGGIGLYPTMVMETADINWLAEVVAHEWIHNYLTLRPLGFSYLNSPELRVMNETAASIAGKEIGRLVVERFYPQFLPPPPQEPEPKLEVNQEPPQPPPFDFRAEMHETRINVDKLLSEKKVDQAEQYMELRRRFLWDNGYHIRKLNQAYFAFYGAYADQPGGAAGTDPVGAAVRALRAQSPSLAAFINRISWMWKFDQLEKVVSEG